MAVPVAIYNTSWQAITVYVNQGGPLLIDGTGIANNWLPATPGPGQPTLALAGAPAPNVIGTTGTNQILAYVDSTVLGGAPFEFSLSTHYSIGSLQIYCMFADWESATWFVLKDGTVVASQTVTYPST